MEDLYQKIEEIEEELKILKEKVKVGIEFTQKLLNECGKAGYKRVSIGKRSKKVPVSFEWPFSCEDSVFVFPSIGDEQGFPVIWRIVRQLGIADGAGNTDQHQINKEIPLIKGVYELKEGKWRKIE